ncbi:MAG: ATP-binding protein [Balneolaceae bacterium]
MGLQKIWESYKKTVHRNCMVSDDQSEGLPYWRNYLFAATLVYVLPFSLFALIPSLYVSWLQGLYLMMVVNVTGVAVLVLVSLLPGPSVYTRKIIYCSIFYFISVTLLYYLGSYGPGLLYLFAGVIFVLLILDTTYGIAAAVLNLLICVLFGFFIHFEWGPGLITYEYDLESWIAVSSNLILLCFLTVVLLPILFNGLHSTLKKSDQLRLDLEASNKELEQFATVASHDLKEPLRMVRSFVGLLEKNYGSKLDEKGKKYIYYARDGAARMSRLVDDLLEFSRIGRLYKELERVDVGTLLDEVRKFHVGTIEETNAELRWGDMPEVTGVTISLKLLFQNLIGNSLKYRAEKRPPVIEIIVVEDDHYWRFSIWDNGIGIEEKYFDTIFQIFKRLHSQDKYTGSGIGLAVCKKIVEQHGGRIWVESKPGDGTVFHFTLSKQL